jgi:hypothetical protein
VRKSDRGVFGYRELKHADFTWLANEEGARFLAGIDDWSPEKLAVRKGWNCRQKTRHAVYLARDQDGALYLVKSYAAEGKRKFLSGREPNRAGREFARTFFAHKKGISTVLPLAVGEGLADPCRGVIIYPFLDKAIPLERIYQHEDATRLAIGERQSLERKVGKLLRSMVDAGAYPVDGHLDHFLALRADGGEISVYYIDLERIGFRSLTKKWFLGSKRVKTLGRVTARLEWLRVSGGRINRVTMMRMSRAFFHQERPRPLDKKLCRKVIRAARRYWYRREFHQRGPYLPRSFSLMDKAV